MHVSFAIPELAVIDALRSEVLCLPLFEDERPLRGAAGLVDWRLCGHLSELLARGTVSGAVGEHTLLPARPRLHFDRMILLGVGLRQAFDGARALQVTKALWEVLFGLKVRAAVIVLPGRALDVIEPEVAMQTLLDVSSEHEHLLDDVTVVDSHPAEKRMSPLIERHKRRLLAELG